jgi:succinate dehydrogenase/fumarate reductase cytochrome b subunit
MTLRRLHRGLAVALGLFIALHLFNHLAGLAGQDAHRRVQEALRPVYRNGLVEPLLLLAMTLQAGVGLRLLTARHRLTLQTASGGYLALFLLIHVGAVMTARWQGIDTDLAFAAAGLHAHTPWPLVFALYYGLAVTAVFAHLSVPIARRQPTAARFVLGSGVVVVLALVLLLSGRIYPLDIPARLISAFP